MQIAAFALVALVAACDRASAPEATIQTARGPVTVALEVATTPEAQQRGLMYRQSLADGHGMLFTFHDDSDHQFWMKNTLIPLDMLFIGSDLRVVGVHADAVPLSTALVSVGKPSRYVLEVPGGWAARHGVAAGDVVALRGVDAGAR